MDYLFKLFTGLASMLAGGAAAAWIAWRFLKRSENPGSLVLKWILTGAGVVFLIVYVSGMGLLAPGIAAAVGIVLGIIWAPSIGMTIAKPLTAFYDGGDVAIEDRPFYSIARAKQKQGKLHEAMADVRGQLERFPNDYEGWMILAEINGDGLKDNGAAQECIEEIFRHDPPHTPKNLVFALTRSADWHLALASDRAAARAAFERIINVFPDTEFAHTAAQRIAHLTSDAMLAAQRERPRIALARHEANIGLMGEYVSPLQKPEDPAERAAALVTHLNEHPFDASAREELAMIYAGHYGRMELAEDQIEQLIAAPGASQKNVSHYLNLLADFKVRFTQDQTGAEKALRRIIERYPNSAVASRAEQRITCLPTELKGKIKSQALQLGSYEENIGLKGQVPKIL